MSTVVINRTYRSANNGSIIPATSDASWEALQERVRALGLDPKPYSADDGTDGVTVECDRERGPNGAYTVHNLACRYGALAVVR